MLALLAHEVKLRATCSFAPCPYPTAARRAQVLVTKEDFCGHQHYLSMPNCFQELLQQNVIPIVNENDDHIARHGSRHSEAIIAENQAHLDTFLQVVDATVVCANPSKAFTNGGQFGLGPKLASVPKSCTRAADEPDRADQL